jgi:flagellar biosynthesis protein FlhG
MLEVYFRSASNAESSARAAHVVAIASGKGGVGKTWFAITLSHALARAGQRVLLFDGDLGLANIDIQLGLCGGSNLSDVVAGRLSLTDAIQTHEAGFDILVGRSGAGTLSSVAPGVLEEVLTELRHVARRYDVLLLDLGAGLERAVRRMAIFADTMLVVATDEPTSLTDAYAVMKVYKSDLGGKSGQVRVVVNLAATRASGERTFLTLERASTTFLGCSPSCAGVIRRDERVRDSIRRQALLLARHPSSPAAVDVEAICESLLPIFARPDVRLSVLPRSF